MTRTGRMPDLDALALLVAVSRTGSIGGAARETGVSQQSASERLTTMERTIGVPLLHRGVRGTALTAAGIVVVEWAAQLLQLANQVEASITALRTERDQELRVVASMTIAEHLLPRWLVALRQQQTATDRSVTSVSLRATNTTEALAVVAQGAADLGFVEGVDQPVELSSREIGTDELVLVASPADPWARRRRPLTAAQVAAAALTSREPGSGTREVVEQALAEHGLVMAPPAVEVTTSTGVRESVRAGGAPAFLSRRAVQADLDSRTLVQVPTEGLTTTRVFRAVWIGGRHPPAGPARDLISVAIHTS